MWLSRSACSRVFEHVGQRRGPVFGLYMLSSGLLKGGLLGTTTWFFATTNAIRLPLTVFVWRNFTLETLGLVMVQARRAGGGVLRGPAGAAHTGEAVRYFRLAAARRAAPTCFCKCIDCGNQIPWFSAPRCLFAISSLFAR